MPLKSLLLSLAVLVGVILPANATTFRISFDASASGVGEDWSGTFVADSTGGLVSFFSALINGTVFDSLIYSPSFGASFATAYFPVINALGGASTSVTAIARDPLGPASQPGLLMTNSFQWGVGTCNSGGSCSTQVQGTYAISVATVPLPAGGLLLVGALGGLALVRRRKAKLSA